MWIYAVVIVPFNRKQVMKRTQTSILMRLEYNMGILSLCCPARKNKPISMKDNSKNQIRATDNETMANYLNNLRMLSPLYFDKHEIKGSNQQHKHKYFPANGTAIVCLLFVIPAELQKGRWRVTPLFVSTAIWNFKKSLKAEADRTMPLVFNNSNWWPSYGSRHKVIHTQRDTFQWSKWLA